MKIGYFGINIGAFDNAESIARLVETLEQAGFESAWTGEHVILADPQVAPSPVPPQSPFVDTIATLAYAAGRTKTIKLGSGIILLPQRNPVVLANELAGVDVVSQGRLLVGVGVGYVEKEFEVLGIPYAERGARMTEHIDAMRAMWTEKPEFQGQFTQISGIQSRPLPVQPGGPPIHVGGMSPPALRRAVGQGDGWYGFFQDVEATQTCLRGLEEAAKKTERPEALGQLEISVTPPGGIDADTMKRFEDIGVDRLVLMRSFEDMAGVSGKEAEDASIRFVEETSKELGLH